MSGPRSFGHNDLPDDQQHALRRAKRLQIFSICYQATAVVAIVAVMGTSQAMKAAWIEDMLSFLPPIAFLIAVHYACKKPNRDHPYGYHRAIGAAHLAAAVALVAMGLFVLYEAISTLVRVEHPAIGTVHLFGRTFWQGWLMIAAMVYSGLPQVVLGRLKLRMAGVLHDRVLFADAQMNKADWTTASAGIVGVVGIGLGFWWADAVAAGFIGFDIVHDGVSNVKAAVASLLDTRARTYDDKHPEPLIDEIDGVLAEEPWILHAASRVRDEGHVLHVESFVVPRPGQEPTLARLETARRRVSNLDWKIEDMVIAPVSAIPEHLQPATTAPASISR